MAGCGYVRGTVRVVQGHRLVQAVPLHARQVVQGLQAQLETETDRWTNSSDDSKHGVHDHSCNTNRMERTGRDGKLLENRTYCYRVSIEAERMLICVMCKDKFFFQKQRRKANTGKLRLNATYTMNESSLVTNRNANAGTEHLSKSNCFFF